MISQLNPVDFLQWQTHASATGLPVVLDVRESWELEIASIAPDGFTLVHIPMQSIPAQLARLQSTYAADQPIACLCHHGIRSQQVASYLAHNGFTDVVNLQGGIAAWSTQVDSNVAQY